MKRFLAILLAAAVIVTALCALTATAEPATVTGNFTYYNNVTNTDATYSFTFNEADFFAGTCYNHALARMSLRLAMAAFAPESVTALYDTLHFTYTDESIHYPTPAFDYDAGTTTIGYAIGARNCTDEQGNYTLVAVVVRGHGYGEEWGSNFEMGAGNRHAGFEKSAKQVTDGVFDFMKTTVAPGTRVKFWLTGFSRAAAVANVTAHNLNEAIGDGTLDATADDVFAYIFESPRTVTTDEPGYDSDLNIFNIVNPIDLVTQLPPTDWGYVRYGIDCLLPDSETTEGYDALKAREVAEFTKILEAAGVANAAAEAETRSATIDNQTSRNIQFINDLAATFGDHQTFAANSERDLCTLLAAALGENGDPLSLLLNNPFPASLAVIFGYMSNIETVLYGHYPELELAWMDALTEEELSPTPGTIPTTGPSATATEPQPTAPSIVAGDVNLDGLVNMKDVLLVRKYLADMPADLDLAAADMNGDGTVNMKDVLALRKQLAGIGDTPKTTQKPTPTEPQHGIELPLIPIG